MTPIDPAKADYHTDDRRWQLLRGDAGALYILVHCEASVMSYDCLIELNDDELKDHHGLGWLAIQHLANRINYFTEEYRSRRITGLLLTAAMAAPK